ncbi:transposable element Tcb1 transposase [Trichonephila clavipes]|nr:transposable element Tcb1 transposase [Trichonephila clavipes]
MKEGYGGQNGRKLYLLTIHAYVCNTTMVGFESGDTVERGCSTAPQQWSCPRYYGMGGIGYHSRTPLVRISGSFKQPALHLEVLEPLVLPYLQDLTAAIFQLHNAQPHKITYCPNVLHQSPD